MRSVKWELRVLTGQLKYFNHRGQITAGVRGDSKAMGQVPKSSMWTCNPQDHSRRRGMELRYCDRNKASHTSTGLMVLEIKIT